MLYLIKSVCVNEQEKIPESYAFVVVKNQIVYENAVANDMRVLGVLVAVRLIFSIELILIPSDTVYLNRTQQSTHKWCRI